MTDFGFSEILDLENVRIDTSFKSASCIHYTAGANEGHTMNVCDLEFQGQPSRSRDCFLTFLISLTSKMLESTPRSTLYHVCNRRYERSCIKVFDLDFQGHAMK